MQRDDDRSNSTAYRIAHRIRKSASRTITLQLTTTSAPQRIKATHRAHALMPRRNTEQRQDDDAALAHRRPRGHAGPTTERTHCAIDQRDARNATRVAEATTTTEGEKKKRPTEELILSQVFARIVSTTHGSRHCNWGSSYIL